MNRYALIAAWSLTVAGNGCFLLCIAAGALVSTPSGRKRIEQLRIGDAVFSVDVETGALVEVTITDLRAAARECVAVELLGGERLVCTPSHPIYDPERGEYRQAGDWISRDATQILRVIEGKAVAQAVSLVSAYAGVREVFDITVDGGHSNFIADGVVVHNKTPAYDDVGYTGYESESESGDDPDAWLADADANAIPCDDPLPARSLCLTIDDSEFMIADGSAQLSPSGATLELSFTSANANGLPSVELHYPGTATSQVSCDDDDTLITATFDGETLESHPDGVANPCTITVPDEPPVVGQMSSGSFTATMTTSADQSHTVDAVWADVPITQG